MEQGIFAPMFGDARNFFESVRNLQNQGPFTAAQFGSNTSSSLQPVVNSSSNDNNNNNNNNNNSNSIGISSVINTPFFVPSTSVKTTKKFIPKILMDNNSKAFHIQNICSMDEHTHLSQEELQVIESSMSHVCNFSTAGLAGMQGSTAFPSTAGLGGMQGATAFPSTTGLGETQGATAFPSTKSQSEVKTAQIIPASNINSVLTKSKSVSLSTIPQTSEAWIKVDPCDQSPIRFSIGNSGTTISGKVNVLWIKCSR